MVILGIFSRCLWIFFKSFLPTALSELNTPNRGPSLRSSDNPSKRSDGDGVVDLPPFSRRFSSPFTKNLGMTILKDLIHMQDAYRRCSLPTTIENTSFNTRIWRHPSCPWTRSNWTLLHCICAV